MEDNKIMELENYETETELVNQEKSGIGSLIAALVVGGAIVAGGAIILARKTKDKREAMAIERLRKKGYVIYKAETVDESKIDEIFEDEVEDDE